MRISPRVGSDGESTLAMSSTKSSRTTADRNEVEQRLSVRLEQSPSGASRYSAALVASSRRSVSWEVELQHLACGRCVHRRRAPVARRAASPSCAPQLRRSAGSRCDPGFGPQASTTARPTVARARRVDPVVCSTQRSQRSTSRERMSVGIATRRAAANTRATKRVRRPRRRRAALREPLDPRLDPHVPGRWWRVDLNRLLDDGLDDRRFDDRRFNGRCFGGGAFTTGTATGVRAMTKGVGSTCACRARRLALVVISATPSPTSTSPRIRRPFRPREPIAPSFASCAQNLVMAARRGDPAQAADTPCSALSSVSVSRSSDGSISIGGCRNSTSVARRCARLRASGAEAAHAGWWRDR